MGECRYRGPVLALAGLAGGAAAATAASISTVTVTVTATPTPTPEATADPDSLAGAVVLAKAATGEDSQEALFGHAMRLGAATEKYLEPEMTGSERSIIGVALLKAKLAALNAEPDELQAAANQIHDAAILVQRTAEDLGLL